jgi:hypothetical protein
MEQVSLSCSEKCNIGHLLEAAESNPHIPGGHQTLLYLNASVPFLGSQTASHLVWTLPTFHATRNSLPRTQKPANITTLTQINSHIAFLPSKLSDMILYIYTSCMEYAVAQLGEALRYMPEGRGFDSR